MIRDYVVQQADMQDSRAVWDAWRVFRSIIAMRAHCLVVKYAPSPLDRLEWERRQTL